MGQRTLLLFSLILANIGSILMGKYSEKIVSLTGCENLGMETSANVKGFSKDLSRPLKLQKMIFLRQPICVLILGKELGYAG